MSKDPMYPWFVQGVSPDGEYNSTKQEYITTCLWCTHEKKLYINPEKKFYHCKVCSHQGNYLGFLSDVNTLNQEQLKDHHLEVLSINRDLPIDAFRGYEIGWNGRAFSIPMRDIDGNLINLGLFRPKPGEKIMNSQGSLGMLCPERLKDHMYGPIFVCEGFWDLIAMTWLLKETNEKGTVIGMPGAMQNISPWSQFLLNKQVIVLYDNDPAGIDGEFKIYKVLDGKTQSLGFLHWPETKPLHYDLRDHVVKHKANPAKAYRLIQKWLHDVPREWANYAVQDRGKITIGKPKKYDPLTYQELLKSYQNLLYLPNTDGIKVMLGTIYANRFRSSMIWLFMVSPPSTGKSELILSLQNTPEVEFVSDVSEHAFISGYKGANGSDPSLFDKLQNRIMAVKDFTPWLHVHPTKQDAIFGPLRDAYDGKTDKKYGHEIQRSYKNLHFGIIAGVTMEIEKIGNTQRALGERFLRYRLPKEQDEKPLIRRAMSNMLMSTDKRLELRTNVLRFLETNKDSNVPKRTEEMIEKVMSIGQFAALLRGVVSRDFKERIEYMPSKEGSSRLCVQLGLLATGMACLEKKEEVEEDEIRIIKEIALNSCPDFVRIVAEFLHSKGGSYLRKLDIEKETGIPMGTLSGILDNMVMLEIIDKKGEKFKSIYGLSELTKTLIQTGQIFPEVKTSRVFTL